MKKRVRLTRQRDFQRLLSGSRIYQGRTLVAFGEHSGSDALRVGVAASRQIKGAVARNRAKRRLREAVRTGVLASAATPQAALSVILIARAALLRGSFAVVVAETREAFARLPTA